MGADKYTPRDIDDLLAELLSSVRGETGSVLYVEHAALILHYCIKNLEPSIYRSYLKLNAYPLVTGLDTGSIRFMNYRTLLVYPELMEEIARIEPSAAGEKVDQLKRAVKQQLNYYSCILGRLDRSGLEQNQQRKLDGYREEASAEDVNIVVVSNLTSEKGGIFGIGKVVCGRLNMDISGEGSIFHPAEPFISFEERVSGKDDPFNVQLLKAVRCAERSVENKYRRWEAARIPRVYRFGIIHSGRGGMWAEKFTGGSAGLPFLILAGTALDNLTNSRVRHRIRKNVVMTGRIDEDGNILPVEDRGIPLKTAAAFYSPCRRFVLPEKNLPAASRELSVLSGEYPEKELKLVPADHVEQVYNNPEIVEKTEIPVLRTATGRARVWRKHLFAAAAVIVAAVILALLLPPRFERSTVSYKFDGQTITFVNKYDYGFRSYTPNYHILNTDNNYLVPAARSWRIFLRDITGNGSRELLFLSVESDSNATKPAGRIHTHLFSNSGKLITHMVVIDTLVLREGKNTRIYNDFTCCCERLMDMENDGYMELVIASVHISNSRSITAVVSFSDENYRAYCHNGHLKHVITGDFCGDEMEEIVLAGDRNQSSLVQYGVLSVIDPMVLSERKPTGKLEIDPRNYQNPSRYYVKIPVSGLCSVMEGCNRPAINDLTVGENDRIKMGVGENTDLQRGLAIIYRIGREMACESITFTDPYRLTYARVFKLNRSRLEEELDEEKDKLIRGFRYFNGEEWVNRPVVSSAYSNIKQDVTREKRGW